MRGAFTLIGDAAVRLYFVLFQRAPAVFGFLAELAVHCFLGAVADALQIAGRCGSVVQCFIGVAAAIATRRTRIYRSRHGSQGKLHCRGSGFRNLFLSIFVLFLLGGFLLEGNPPGKGGGGLAAPPFFFFFFFRDQFAHCPWVHVSQDGEQCENGDLVFCLPYGLWLPSFSWLP